MGENSIITIEGLDLTVNNKIIFKDTGFSLNEGQKAGLIGVNGTGKSTLLKIIDGLLEPDKGKISLRRNIKISYLPQTPVFLKDETVMSYILRENPIDPYDTEISARKMIKRLLDVSTDTLISSLSGGQKKRAALISCLLSKSDILLLDEPTNHLDSEMSEYLEECLKNYKGSIVMVTHDRYFLDEVTDIIVELDHGKIYSYNENYTGFLRRKEERLEREESRERKRLSILRKELKWVMRGAKARSTKQKGRLQRFEELSKEEKPLSESETGFSSISSRLGNTTIEIDNISLSLSGKTLIKDFSYNFLRNDRIGITGHNGAGKTSLLKLIVGEIKADSGNIKIGQTVKIGYFSQENENLPDDKKLLDYITDFGSYLETAEGRISAEKLLEKFLFTSSQIYTNIGRLSGGEKRRLYLLRILITNPNVLILDEPTNDLDIKTMTTLEDFLDSFQGIVISVSHDRYFLDRSCQKIFNFEDGSIKCYNGNYSEFLSKKEIHGSKNKEASSRNHESQNIKSLSVSDKDNADPVSETSNHLRKIKFSYREKKDWETIEEEIKQLEDRIHGIDSEMELNSHDFKKLSELQDLKDETEELLLSKMERWEYLSDLNEKIQAEG